MNADACEKKRSNTAHPSSSRCCMHVIHADGCEKNFSPSSCSSFNETHGSAKDMSEWNREQCMEAWRGGWCRRRHLEETPTQWESMKPSRRWNRTFKHSIFSKRTIHWSEGSYSPSSFRRRTRLWCRIWKNDMHGWHGHHKNRWKWRKNR